MTINCIARFSHWSVLLLLAATLLLNSCAPGSSEEKENPSKAEQIDELVGLYAAYDGFNGSVLVAHEGEVMYKNGFGMANKELDVPNAAETKFRIASVTKPFTAILILQLVAENKIDLHTPISAYLPDYPKAIAEQITIHQLLTHTAGVPRDYDHDTPENKYPDRHRPQQLVKEFWELDLEFTPGDHFAYSNTGYMILTYLIETIMERSYEEVLQEKILTPLAMENTGSDKHRPLIKNRASGYFKGFGDYFNADFSDMSKISGVGNMYSTVEDLYILDQALYSDSLLPKKYQDLLFEKHISDPDYGGHYGYGWELIPKKVGNTSETVQTIGHSGSIQGFRALFTRIPSSNSTVIFLNNSGGAYLNAMTTAITGILNDTTYDFPRKPLAQFMQEVMGNEGVEKAIQFYKEHQEDAEYYISENELIVAGYRLLHAGNAIDAAEVFKLSTEVFPDKDNPYDSYAEALMTLGKNEEAIKNYKKSLELNPNNGNAIEMLKKLEK